MFGIQLGMNKIKYEITTEQHIERKRKKKKKWRIIGVDKNV